MQKAIETLTDHVRQHCLFNSQIAREYA